MKFKLILFCFCMLCASNLLAAERNVKVFVHSSKFKSAVADKLLLKLTDYKVELLDIEKLETTKFDDVSIFVIINQTQWLKPNKKVIQFVEELSDSEKTRVIVLSTAGTKGKDIKVPGVDSITSASEMSRVNELSDAILDKIKNI